MKPWMPDVEIIATAAKGGYGNDGEMEATAIVTHVMQGYISTMRAWAAERPAHHRVSYHFVIALGGTIVQFVPIDTPAWHAGRLDPATRVPWNNFTGDNPNMYTVAVAFEGFSGPRTPNEAQTEAALRVYRFVLDEHQIIPSRDTLIGHRDIAPISRAHDPGPGWDVEDFLAMLNAPRLEPSPAGELSPLLKDLDAIHAIIEHGLRPLPIQHSIDEDGEPVIYDVYELKVPRR